MNLLLIYVYLFLEKIKDIVSQTWFDLNVRSEVKTLEIEEQGAVII